jgi:hypothetical protein
MVILFVVSLACKQSVAGASSLFTMKRKRMNHIIFIIFTFAFIFLTGYAQSAELDPFVLPEPNTPYNQNQTSAPPPKVPVVNESVYERFQKKMRTLSKKTKMDLSKSFQEKRDKAFEKEEWDKVKHYKRLLEILMPPKERAK